MTRCVVSVEIIDDRAGGRVLKREFSDGTVEQVPLEKKPVPKHRHTLRIRTVATRRR